MDADESKDNNTDVDMDNRMTQQNFGGVRPSSKMGGGVARNAYGQKSQTPVKSKTRVVQPSPAKVPQSQTIKRDKN